MDVLSPNMVKTITKVIAIRPFLEEKAKQAESILQKCLGDTGVWASPDRYKYQCWTRDLCVGLIPYASLNIDNKPFTHSVKLKIKTQLLEISKRQSDKGQTPILFIDNEKKFIRDKVNKSIATGKTSFMLDRYLDDQITDLTPHTNDSEILFSTFAYEFIDAENCTCTYKESEQIMNSIIKALEFVERTSVGGLILGADWRDTRTDLADKIVLSNTCFLYRMYCIGQRGEASEDVLDTLQGRFWNGEYFNDYVESDVGAVDKIETGCDETKESNRGLCSDNFDLFGNSLAIIFQIGTPEQTKSIIRYAKKHCRKAYGYSTLGTYLPALNTDEADAMKKDKNIVWPFVNYYFITARLVYLMTSIAPNCKETLSPEDLDMVNDLLEDFIDLVHLDDFYEWYGSDSTKGYGSSGQMWSAVTFLTVYNTIKAIWCDKLEKDTSD
ncbi:glycogen debranching enzyme alpha-1,6-glucosidase [Yasminevirus sp. GU-2018]|uniref:Glycogen debranching enzyme alpha-1,6-glucosidase n=1 Tax=Yasminevirus sp. GU-2018 TaxID=2420051 RepID=A0A5K0U9D7_9VIRU|nr:glycogen debranching enzyme alpha-1,6-glucosidase [Yasminevirus sp. GU-2018]